MKIRNDKRRIGIFGFGCVGQGLYDIIQANPQYGLEVASICVKTRNKQRSLPASAFSYDPNQLLHDESIDIFAELISDADEALTIVRHLLKAGKTVVSANKKMVAENLSELLQLQQQYGGVLLYEAAVCGSIPIVRLLDSYFGAEPLKQVSGVLNGSSNYILSKLYYEGISYQEALAQAQALGFAEADPTLDVQGNDALNKLCIVAAHAFGQVVHPEEVLCFGMQHIHAEDVALAQAIGAKIKLVASAQQAAGQQLRLQVLPAFVLSGNELFTVDAEFNGVQVEAEFAGTQFLKGRGAGSHPTGSAVWADVAAALSGFRYSYSKKQTATAGRGETEVVNLYIRAAEAALLENLPLQEVLSLTDATHQVQVICSISVSELRKHQEVIEKAGIFVASLPIGLNKEELLAASTERYLSFV
ncbi:homoserine dehydrogenase [Pontibacter sp. 13R65]|uniref:homoserine dehydrogenase n=1 Tax=Pontibacter sp. 13R65 TaxID=3127458 RepID=UPI00301D520A